MWPGAFAARTRATKEAYVKIRAVQRQVLDGDLRELQFRGCKPNQGLGQGAVDGIARETPDKIPDLEG
jgi:hypothetical protein